MLSIDNPAGPGSYKVSKDADVTVVLYNQHKVKAKLCLQERRTEGQGYRRERQGPRLCRFPGRCRRSALSSFAVPLVLHRRKEIDSIGRKKSDAFHGSTF